MLIKIDHSHIKNSTPLRTYTMGLYKKKLAVLIENQREREINNMIKFAGICEIKSRFAYNSFIITTFVKYNSHFKH